MKDLGTLLGLNLDSNQKHVKDHTKPMVTDGGKSPAAVSKKSAKKQDKLVGPKQPTGKITNRKKLFSKIKKKLNVEVIPGSEIKK